LFNLYHTFYLQSVEKKQEKAKKEAAERIKKYEKRLRKTEVNVKR